MALRYITSEKKKKKLCDEENYVYEKHRDNPAKTKTYWRCELFYQGCKARIHTPCNCNEPTLLYSSGNHTHPASKAAVDARVAVSEMRDAIHGGSGSSTRDIIASATQSLDENAKSKLQNVSSLSRSIQSWRRTTLGIPALPTSRTGYEIPDAYKYLPDGSLFLAFDSGVEDSDRILIFATEEGLNDLSTNNIWSCDGTFKASPSLWTQLFTIHFVLKGRCFPRIFALLPNKQEATYRRLFFSYL